MELTAIRTATADGVATITLARPERLNAFTSAMHAELRRALDAAESDDAVRCVVLTGEGRAFSRPGRTSPRIVCRGRTARPISARGSSATTIRWSSASMRFPR